MNDPESIESQTSSRLEVRSYDSLRSSGEVREYIEEMKASGNIEALETLRQEVKKRIDAMHGGVGGEYEFQFHLYVEGELEKVLGAEN